MPHELDEPTTLDAMKLIEMALAEDIGAADLKEGVCCTTDAIVPPQSNASAAFVARDDGVVCGLEIVNIIISKYAPDLELNCFLNDGDRVQSKQSIAVISGPAHRILVCERTCLNFMCRLSGISSLTRQYVDAIKGTKAQVLDTRKTTPGWRRLEKYAVQCGGGANHRMGLYDAVMIKDNHLAFFRTQVDDKNQTIPQALELARKWIVRNSKSLPNGDKTVIQLEVDNLQQLDIALQAGPDIVLLDNMSNDQLTQAVAMRNDTNPNVLLEASGGVNLDTIGKIAQTGVERISVGALTHSAMNFDIGLDWQIQ